MRRSLVVLVVVAFVVAAVLAGRSLLTPDDRRITASFGRVVGLYQGDDVRVLGVRVGEVTAIVREADTVKVEMTVDPAVDVPANASAVLVSPSLVSGRYVQLTPVYRGGAEMLDGGVIPMARTQVPVEFDELKNALNKFGTDLGPDGRKDDSGPLGRALEAASANLDGQGRTMHDTLEELSSAVTTLSDSRGDIFLTVRNLASFTEMLARTDAQVRSFATQMAQLTGELDDSRVLIGQTLDRLDAVVPQVRDFLRENRSLLKGNVNQLSALSDTLVKERQNLADILQVAPTTISNAYNIYDPKTQSSTGALILPYTLARPSEVVCWLFESVGAGNDCSRISGVLKFVDDALTKPEQAAAATGGLASLLSPAGGQG